MQQGAESHRDAPAAWDAAIGSGVALACDDGMAPGVAGRAAHDEQAARCEWHGQLGAVLGMGEVHKASGAR